MEGSPRASGWAARLRRRVVAHASALACLAFAGVAQATENLPEQPPAAAVLETPVGKSAPLRAAGPVGRVVVSQPELVEVGIAGPDELYVIGREVGTTNLLVYGRDGRLAQSIDLRVGYDAAGLRESLGAALPERAIKVTGLADGLLIEGEVATPAEAKAVEALAQRAAPDSVVSRLHIQNAVVRVDVRIAEISSRRLKALGASLGLDDGHVAIATRDLLPSLTSPHLSAGLDTHLGDYRLTAALRALEETGDAEIVAQPTLVVESGATGDFQAGGELAYPVPRDDKIDIEFRPYGARLKVRPTVQANGLVRLEIEAELSEIDPQNGLTVRRLQVPGLLTRKTSTVAELRDGQTLRLAGLLEQHTERRVAQSPWIGKIPLVGPLLRTARGQDQDRELAIFVTPHVGTQAPATLEAIREAGTAPTVRAAAPEPPRRPAAKGPRGPPLKAVAQEAWDAVKPPARWLWRQAKRVVGLFA